MKKKILLLSLFLLISFSASPAQALQEVDQTNIVPEEIQSKKLDNKAQILSAYFAKHNSPLETSAQDFIDAANQYNLDWKLVAAISGVESTFGKHIPGGYNGWGWGVYGTQAIYFESWREAIFTISKGLRENYINKGYTEPYSMNRIYAASPFWGGKVTYFMNQIDKFAAEYETENAELGVLPSTIAASSGVLTYNTN